MAKSTRQYVFDGMEVLPEALAPFVTKRLESALTGHWQVRVAEKLRLQAGRNGDIARDQAALLNAMDRFWMDAFKMSKGPGTGHPRRRGGGRRDARGLPHLRGMPRLGRRQRTNAFQRTGGGSFRDGQFVAVLEIHPALCIGIEVLG